MDMEEPQIQEDVCLTKALKASIKCRHYCSCLFDIKIRCCTNRCIEIVFLCILAGMLVFVYSCVLKELFYPTEMCGDKYSGLLSSIIMTVICLHLHPLFIVCIQKSINLEKWIETHSKFQYMINEVKIIEFFAEDTNDNITHVNKLILYLVMNIIVSINEMSRFPLFSPEDEDECDTLLSIGVFSLIFQLCFVILFLSLIVPIFIRRMGHIKKRRVVFLAEEP